MAKALSLNKEKSELLFWVSFIFSLLALVLLFYVWPQNYSYNHSGLSLVVAAVIGVAIIRGRSHSLKQSAVKIADLASVTGLSSIVNFVVGFFVLYLAVKDLILYLTSSPLMNTYMAAVSPNPILPAAVLSTLIIYGKTGNKEEKKLSDWTLSLVVVSLLFELFYSFALWVPHYVLHI